MMEIENEDPYKKSLNANEFYFNRAVSRLEQRNTCVPVQYFDDDGNELSQKIFQIADYDGDSVTISKKGAIIKVALDGTNFISKISRAEDGDFKCYMYINKALDIEYRLIEEKIDEDMYICNLAKRVNDIVIAIRYCVAGDYTVILKAKQLDNMDNHTVEIENEYYDDKDKKRLIAYMNDMKDRVSTDIKECAMEELKEKYGEDSEEYQFISQELDDFIDEDLEPEDDEVEYGLDDEGDFENGVIYYGDKDHKPMSTKEDYLPSDVNNFSYNDYIRASISVAKEDKHAETHTSKEENSGLSEEYKQKEQLYTEVMSTVFDTMIEDVDTVDFSAYINKRLIDDEKVKEDVVMTMYQTVELEHQEIQDLAEYIDEIYNIVESAERIVNENKEAIIAHSKDEEDRDI